MYITGISSKFWGDSFVDYTHARVAYTVQQKQRKEKKQSRQHNLLQQAAPSLIMSIDYIYNTTQGR